MEKLVCRDCEVLPALSDKLQILKTELIALGRLALVFDRDMPDPQDAGGEVARPMSQAISPLLLLFVPFDRRGECFSLREGTQFLDELSSAEATCAGLRGR